jgi:hypothetical protein
LHFNSQWLRLLPIQQTKRPCALFFRVSDFAFFWYRESRRKVSKERFDWVYLWWLLLFSFYPRDAQRAVALK